ncbi:MAG: PEP-CTERM sorting domain-containing protein [Gemmataceae bacterium]
MFLRAVLCSLAGAAWTAAPAPAALVVSVGSASVAAGGTGTVDVFVSGPDRLDYFVGEFRITPVGSAPAGGLLFVAPPPLPPLAAANYVFAGNSFAASQLPANPGAVTTSVRFNDTYTVGDFTLDNLGVDVSAPRLLTRLSFSAGGAVPDGSRYTLSLNPLGSQFQNPDFADLPFTGTLGTITVTARPTDLVVPEPSSLVILLTGLAACVSGRSVRPLRTGGVRRVGIRDIEQPE